MTVGEHAGMTVEEHAGMTVEERGNVPRNPRCNPSCYRGAGFKAGVHAPILLLFLCGLCVLARGCSFSRAST
jgi:hypothetical protein